MEYHIVVKPGKEEAFLQLLRSWQELGVILRYQQVTDKEDTSKTDAGSGKRKAADPNVGDPAQHYRDLVD